MTRRSVKDKRLTFGEVSRYTPDCLAIPTHKVIKKAMRTRSRLDFDFASPSEKEQRRSARSVAGMSRVEATCST